MPVAVDIREDLSGLSARLGLLAGERVSAAVRALNRSMMTVRKEAGIRLRQDYPGLPAMQVRKRIKLDKATRAQARAALRFSNKRLRLFNWQLAQIKTRWGTGVRAGKSLPQLLRVDAISGRVTPIPPEQLAHAFVQRSRRAGIPNIWLRQGKDSVPIDVLVTPSLSEVLVASRINETLARRARQRFSEVFVQESLFRLSKR